ncbi:MAG: glycoside hydrolase family 3 protein [Spirochaetota bacterium]
MSEAKSKHLGSILLAALLLSSASPDAGALSFWDDVPNATLRERLLEAMTPQEVIAQTLMLGWLGERPSAEIVEWLAETSLGGVKVFGWNGGNLVTLAETLGEMQGRASEHRLGIPLITATDQEGGWVRHVKGRDDLTTSITPGNMAIGASSLPYDAYRSAYYIGMELRALGINMNFAPTVDVYVNPEAHVIGPRAFSDDPVLTGVLGVAFYQGLEEARVIATAKHFPGHGNAAEDSHGVLPVLDDSYDELAGRDLVPYRFLVNEGVPAVLTGHLSFPNVSGDERPASLSPHFIHDLLRGTLGFRGLVITDDLYMGGAWEYGADHGWGIAEIVIEALRAGNDMVMLSRTPDLNGALTDRLVELYNADPDFRARVRDAAGRVLDLKLAYLKPTDRVPLEPDSDRLADSIRAQGGASFFRDQAGRSVAVLRDAGLPLEIGSDERILLAGKDLDFLRIGEELIPDADVYRIGSPRFVGTDARDRVSFRDAAARYDTVVFCLSDTSTAEILAAAEGVEARIVIFSILTPVYLSDLPWVESAIAVFGWGVESFRAGYSVLLGRVAPEGTSPLALRHANEGENAEERNAPLPESD